MGSITWKPVRPIIEEQPIQPTLADLKPVVKVIGKTAVKIGVSMTVIKATGKVVEQGCIAYGVPAPAIPFVRAISSSLVLYVGGKING